MNVESGNPNCIGSLGTVDLLVKIACFVKSKRIFSILKAAGLN